MWTISILAERIAAAAGRSTNVERRLREVRAGGNAFLCARALHGLGQDVTLAANVGNQPNHLFSQTFACGRWTVLSTGQPNDTDALEFSDGKIMLTDSRPLEELTYKKLTEAIGRRSLGELMEDKAAVILTNWTMMPHGTNIYEKILSNDLKKISYDIPIFFDLADPARRSNGELIELLDLIASFAGAHRIYVSINLKEMERVAGLLMLGEADSEKKPQNILRASHQRWPVEWVLHRMDGADSCGRSGEHMVEGFFAERPHTTTGGGDHFNGGFIFGILNGLPPEAALLVGNAVSGVYVQLGRSPTADEVVRFLSMVRHD
jgi:sugar/nucleoside kinase (ribokinase family)